MTETAIICRYFGLTEVQKELIAKACSEAPWVDIAPLDKGLSGSLALMARWSVGGAESKFHVFKIGDPRKLQKEYEAITQVAAPIMENFPHCAIYVSDDGSKALLSQEFVGDSDGSTRSLRQYIERSTDEAEVVDIIGRLYALRLLHWKPTTATDHRRSMTVNSALKPWIRKGNLEQAINLIGRDALEGSLIERFSLGLDRLQKLIERVFRSHIQIDVGPVHGDLHSQNVIVGQSERISLIDFGWTNILWRAVDYLWLECSLKFVVATQHAKVEDLLAMEDLLDQAWEKGCKVDLAQLDGRLMSADLRKITAGVGRIREEVRSHLPDLTLSDYRKGLLGMAYSLTTFPELNLVHLMHSMARNTVLAETDLDDEGPYQALYAGAHSLLWPGRAGRMVRKATDHSTTTGTALDIGCGDGKDIVFLEDRGWKVTGIDISSRAVAGTMRRRQDHFGELADQVHVSRADATRYDYPTSHYDLIVAYGLYHCLDDDALEIVHAGVLKALKPNGLFAYAAFNDLLPVPDGHQTGELVLRPANHIFELTADDFDVLEREVGRITETHAPMVAEHHHSLTWALLRKR